MTDLKKQMIEETLSLLELDGTDKTDARHELLRELIGRLADSGLNGPAIAKMLSAAGLVFSMTPEAYAAREVRLTLSEALEMDPYGTDGEDLGDDEANRRKAAAVREAALSVARQCLDGNQRTVLASLLREAGRLRESSGLPSLDAVWLFETAISECSPGYAWVENSGLDLAGDLLCVVEAGKEAA